MAVDSIEVNGYDTCLALVEYDIMITNLSYPNNNSASSLWGGAKNKCKYKKEYLFIKWITLAADNVRFKSYYVLVNLFFQKRGIWFIYWFILPYLQL